MLTSSKYSRSKIKINSFVILFFSHLVVYLRRECYHEKLIMILIPEDECDVRVISYINRGIWCKKPILIFKQNGKYYIFAKSNLNGMVYGSEVDIF
jgi:hypothetical protein